MCERPHWGRPSKERESGTNRNHQNAFAGEARQCSGVAPKPDTRRNPRRTTCLPCGRSPHRGSGARGMRGGSPPRQKSAPQKIHTRGRDQRSLTVVRGCPSPGGRARGTARSRPWGGRPVPPLKKFIPNTTRHEAAQVNYNINELMMNRCSAGLFASSRHLSGPPQVTRVRASRALGPVGPHQDPTAALLARGGRASSRKRHVNAPIDQDHELITSGDLAEACFRHTKGLRTARTSEHVSEVPTLDQPREACQARPERSRRQLTGARMVARLTYLPAAAPRDGAPFACPDHDPPPALGTRCAAQTGSPRVLPITNDSLEQT
jgi:hypothetical protein